MRRAAKVDANHGEIVAEFRRLGASVVDLSRVGGGVPDLCIGIAKETALVEVKRDAKAKFTQDQIDFMTWWNGRPVYRVNCIEDAQYVVYHLKGGRA